MGTNIKLILFLSTIVLSGMASASEMILVERYENWNHPVLSVFKEYGISLYKVSYSKDGTCPTFYAKFKYSPDPRAPDAETFHKLYSDTLKANAYFPYAFVDEEDNMRINVGWDDKAKTIMKVDMDKAASISSCRNG